MNRLAWLLAALMLPVAALSQEAEGVAAHRARIAAERSNAEAAFKVEEKACYQKFAVTDCLNVARDKRREAMSDLRRQEISINDAERRRKGAERLREIDERSAADKQAEEAKKREKSLADHETRETRAAQKAAEKASSAASRPAQAASKQAQLQHKQEEKVNAERRRREEAATNAKKHAERLVEAKERKDKLDKRLAERKKPAAQPLPVPP